MCYTYDELSRVTKRTIKNLSDVVLSEESYTYDAAGNVTSAPDSSFQYDTNNRLVTFNGNSVSYDMDGNMLSNGSLSCTYDSANRLISAGGHTYTYNAEDIRIRNLCSDADTTYTYNTNCRLNQLLCKTTNGVVTKYVYGHGLISEDKGGVFKTYHFDYRGSTVAITDIDGNITDTFKYDTYGKLISRTGTSFVIFGYNGRDGVVTDKNGLIYMRARYYSPEMRRFVNADIIPGNLSNAITLNRFAYANGNPVSFVDPFGLSVDTKGSINPVPLYKILRNIKSEQDTELASELLALTLNQLLSFKYILTIESKVSVEIPLVGSNTTITFSHYIEGGNGNVKISTTMSDQLEIASSFSFPMGDNGSISIGDDGTISIEYYADIDEYNSVGVSLSATPFESISAGYIIKTTDKYGASVYTSMELNHKTTPKPPLKQPEFVPILVPEPVPVTVTSPSFENPSTNSHSQGPEKGIDWGWIERATGIVVATGLSVITVFAIAETIATYGAGFWNDALAFSSAVAAWEKVFAN